MTGERVTAVRFTFNEPLQSQRYRFLRWRDGRWEVVQFEALAALRENSPTQ